jgi:Zn-dependent protease
VIAAAMAMLLVATTLLHESGHAIAYRLQGTWPVRITLRGSGGACAAVVYEDSPARGLARALAGPAVTALIIAVLVPAQHAPALPPLWRLVAATVTVFSLFDLIFNALPVFPCGDGTHALRAVLWLLRRQAPEDFAVLYLWRPPILAAAVLALSRAAVRYLPWNGTVVTIAALCALALCAVPPLALVWRRLAGHGLLPASGRQGRA